MQVNESRWKFSVAVLLPVIAAVSVTVALAAGFVFWSAQRTDERSLDRQQVLSTHMIENLKSDLEGAQGGLAVWYEAVDAVKYGKIDKDWLDDNMGSGEYDDYGHQRVYVVDSNLKAVYAARDGDPAAVLTYDEDRAVIDPLVSRFRTPELAAGIAKFQDGDGDYPPQLVDVATVGGHPALVGVTPIVSDWEGEEQKPAHYYYHVAVQYLDGDVASDMMDYYQIEGAHFDTTPDTKTDEAMVPVVNDAGRFVAYFKWKPERPGRALLGETLPASLGLLAVIGVVIALLLFGLARSTRALEKARAEALFRATHDPLTGLANRALFTERLERSPLPLTLLALDLDRFKAVNDSLGHEAGDELLKQVAGRLAKLVRDTDVVARLGGDEFMILLTGSIGAAAVQELAGRVVASLAEPFRLGLGMANIGVSVGIASAVTDERKDLVSRADFALYDAKEFGRNTYRVFDELQKAA